MVSLFKSSVKSLQSCLTLCNPIDGSPPGSPIPGILQARILEWVAISFSNAWKWKVKVKSLSHVWHSETPWPAAFQAPPSMGFSMQEYWSGVPLGGQKWFHEITNKINSYNFVCLIFFARTFFWLFETLTERIEIYFPNLVVDRDVSNMVKDTSQIE